MSFAYHGNYCGPWWSAGAYQTSVYSDVEAVDEFDQVCKEHDAVYALGGNLEEADYDFFRKSAKLGKKAFLAALAVGSQAVVRTGSAQYNNIAMTPKFRKNQPSPVAIPTPKSNRSNRSMQTPASSTTSLGGVQVSAPAAISSVMAARPTKTRNVKDGIFVSGREFISTVEAQGVSTFGIGKSALLAPAYFSGGILGQLSRAYQYYRWKRLIVHYVPKVATNTVGEIVLCSGDNINQPALQPEASNFLQRALVSGNGVMGPLWMPLTMEIYTDAIRRFLDPLVNVDINENIFCELQCYTNIGTTAQPGYLWLDYEVELTCPMLTPHTTTIPIASGPGQRAILTDTSTTNAIGNAVSLLETTTTGLNNLNSGAIYRCVFDIQGSSAPAGSSFGSMWGYDVNSIVSAPTPTFASTSTGFAVTGGFVFYLVVFSGSFRVYATLEGAVGGSASTQIVYLQATTGSGAYFVDYALVRQSGKNFPNVQ